MNQHTGMTTFAILRARQCRTPRDVKSPATKGR